MFVIFSIMLAGIALGYLLRKKKIAWINRIVTPLIWALLLLLGINVGESDAIINNLHTLGLQALIITIGAVLGSSVFAWMLGYFLYLRNKETKE